MCAMLTQLCPMTAVLSQNLKPGHIDDAARQGIGIAAMRPIFCVRRKSGASLSNER